MRIRTLTEPVAGERRPRWWAQLIYAAAFYAVYSWIRNLHGSSANAAHSDSKDLALRHGLDILNLEKALGLDIEHGLQNIFLSMRPLMTVLNFYYSSFHFAATLAVFIVLLFAATPRYFRFWRNTLGIATGLALVVFTLFPTMPPRLMGAWYGYPYHDSLDIIGGGFSYNKTGFIEKISDPFAAMPSLHVVWAGWCGLAIFFWARRWWIRTAALAYPALTSFTIVTNGTHWLADVAGAVVTLALAIWAAKGIEELLARRSSARTATTRTATTQPSSTQLPDDAESRQASKA